MAQLFALIINYMIEQAVKYTLEQLRVIILDTIVYASGINYDAFIEEVSILQDYFASEGTTLTIPVIPGTDGYFSYPYVTSGTIHGNTPFDFNQWSTWTMYKPGYYKSTTSTSEYYHEKVRGPGSAQYWSYLALNSAQEQLEISKWQDNYLSPDNTVQTFLISRRGTGMFFVYEELSKTAQPWINWAAVQNKTVNNKKSIANGYITFTDGTNINQYTFSTYKQYKYGSACSAYYTSATYKIYNYPLQSNVWIESRGVQETYFAQWKTYYISGSQVISEYKPIILTEPPLQALLVPPSVCPLVGGDQIPLVNTPFGFPEEPIPDCEHFLVYFLYEGNRYYTRFLMINGMTRSQALELIQTQTLQVEFLGIYSPTSIIPTIATALFGSLGTPSWY